MPDSDVLTPPLVLYLSIVVCVYNEMGNAVSLEAVLS